MKSVFVYCEVENKEVAEISQELLSAGKRLAQKLGCPLDAMLFGKDLDGIESQISPYGVDKLFISDDSRLEPYRTLPHAALAHKVLKEQDPQIVLFGATSVGRDLAPRLASKLNCGLTADCTVLDIGDHFVKKEKKEYMNAIRQAQVTRLIMQGPRSNVSCKIPIPLSPMTTTHTLKGPAARP